MENIFDITNTDSCLFDAFCRQTRRTFWTFLHNLAQQEDIYSIHLTNFGPYKEPDLNDYYVFCNGQEIVVLFKDAYTLKQEKADRESGKGGGIHVDGIVPIIDATRFIKRRIDVVAPGTKVQSIMLSDRECFDDLMECMSDIEFPFYIIDNLRTLNKRHIEVNEQHGEEGRNIINAIIHCDCIPPEEDELTVKKCFEDGDDYDGDDDDDYDDEEEEENEEEAQDDKEDNFDKELDEFIKRMDECSPYCGPTSSEENNDDNDEEEENEDDEEYNYDKALQDFLERAAEDARRERQSPFSISHSEIEQNENTKVNVEILHCNQEPQLALLKLVGCEEIKRRMDELLSLGIYNNLMRKHFPDSKQHDISLHSIFYGRPGTGKTTVCKIYGALLHQAGVLSSGHVVVCDRGTFIGPLWGDEERTLRKVLEIAKGGVLMIDEAYLLHGKSDRDPGRLVIQLLMNILADESQRDIAVVLCGYKEPMKELLALNPGLDSRFPNKFEFPDFSIEELLRITLRRIDEYDYEFTDQAWEKYRKMLTKAYQMRDPDTWGNARFVANQLDRIYIQHASRCVHHIPKDISEMRTITADDIQPIEVPKPRMRIGF